MYCYFSLLYRHIYFNYSITNYGNVNKYVEMDKLRKIKNYLYLGEFPKWVIISSASVRDGCS